MGLKRQKKVSSALLSLSRSVQELTEENQSLKEDLDRVLSNSPTVSTMKGTVPRTTRGGTHQGRPRLVFSEGMTRAEAVGASWPARPAPEALVQLPQMQTQTARQH